MFQEQESTEATRTPGARAAANPGNQYCNSSSFVWIISVRCDARIAYRVWNVMWGKPLCKTLLSQIIMHSCKLRKILTGLLFKPTYVEPLHFFNSNYWSVTQCLHFGTTCYTALHLLIFRTTFTS